MNENTNRENTTNIELCIQFLEDLVNNPSQLAALTDEQRIALQRVSGKIARPDRDLTKHRNKEVKRQRRKTLVQEERQARSFTGIREARKTPVFKAPSMIALPDNASKNFVGELKSPRNCYICKKEYTLLHFFYDAMCPECADFNYAKRFQTADLSGKTALITGSRLKIGYQATLLLLRAGARVIATTRFPVDSALRFSKEDDYENWKDRLHIYGLDLRHTPSVELFATYIENTYDRLDILINNAAQTVRRPPAFYSHLMANELKPFQELPGEIHSILKFHQNCTDKLNAYSETLEPTELAVPLSWNTKLPGIGIRSSAQLSQIPYTHDTSLPTDEIFPIGQLDADLQQVDLRKTNSWRLRLGEINTAEMIELQLINSIAPFVLCNRLITMMKRDNTGEKHIVNVSAMEGKFHRFTKIDRHPHTNMAKAALNMLTHTAAGGLQKFGIYMNAVDTGWVTDEDPVDLAKHKQDVHDFQPPLDIVDGAARVCDPFFHGILTGHHWCGKFLKDYMPIDW